MGGSVSLISLEVTVAWGGEMAEADDYIIGIPVYDGVGLLDVSVPLERFNRWHQRARLVIPALPRDPAAALARGRTRARRAGGHST